MYTGEEKEHLEEVNRKMIRPFALGLGLLYFAYSVSQFFVLDPDLKPILFPLAMFTSLNYFLTYFFNEPILRKVRPTFLISYLCGLIFLKSALHLILAKDIKQTVSLILIILCLASVTFSWRVFYGFTAVIWTAFGIAFYQSPDTHGSMTFLLGLGCASFLAKIIVGQRISTHIEIMRLYSESGHAQAQELLSGSIAHELCTPLATLSLTSEMLTEDIKKEKIDVTNVTKRLENMNYSIKNMSSLIHKLRIFAGHGLVKARLQPIVLQEVITGALLLKKKEAAEKGVQIITEHLENNIVVNADPSSLLVVINNLIANSIEAIESLPAPRWVKITSTLESDFVVMRITDSGSGIKPAIQNRIFDPLFSTKHNTKTGVGFGLSTARSILKTCDAEINYASGNANTTFIVRFRHLTPMGTSKAA